MTSRKQSIAKPLPAMRRNTASIVPLAAPTSVAPSAPKAAGPKLAPKFTAPAVPVVSASASIASVSMTVPIVKPPSARPPAKLRNLQKSAPIAIPLTKTLDTLIQGKIDDIINKKSYEIWTTIVVDSSLIPISMKDFIINYCEKNDRVLLTWDNVKYELKVFVYEEEADSDNDTVDVKGTVAKHQSEQSTKEDDSA